MPTTDRPDILFPMGRQRRGTCGCYGSHMGLTANLGRSGGQGLPQRRRKGLAGAW
jgi:hypothetical protein